MFNFKQFSVEDSNSPMKVGTDAVLLGAWAPALPDAKILDIGTGCGVISLMLAQRSDNAKITAIDIDNGAWNDACNNFKNSPWSSNIKAIECTVQTFATQHKNAFDIIVSNPPYFEDSLKSNKTKRNIARHTDSLPFAELITAIDLLLNDDGTFAAILPYNEGLKFIAEAKEYGLHCFKTTLVANKPSAEVKRIMFCLSRKELSVAETPTLYIRNEDNSYSAEYLELTKDFYTFI